VHAHHAGFIVTVSQGGFWLPADAYLSKKIFCGPGNQLSARVLPCVRGSTYAGGSCATPAKTCKWRVAKLCCKSGSVMFRQEALPSAADHTSSGLLPPLGWGPQTRRQRSDIMWLPSISLRTLAQNDLKCFWYPPHILRANIVIDACCSCH
jgi:hypothetical protein